MPLEERPTQEYIQYLGSHLTELWSPAHAHFAEIDTYYNRTFALWEPALGRSAFHLAKAKDVVDGAVDQQLAFEPRVHRPPAGGQREINKERADRVEKGVKSQMDESALNDTVLTYKQAGKHLIAYGYTMIEGPFYNTQEQPKKLSKKKASESVEDYERRESIYQAECAGWCAVRTRAVHPARVLMDPLERRPKQAIKTEKVEAFRLHELSVRKIKTRRYAEVYDYDEKNPYAWVEKTDYWSPYWHAVIGPSGLLYVERNTWGYVPYTHAFSGWGMEPTDASQVDPKYLAVGILEGVMETLKAQSQGASGLHNAMMETTYPVRGTRQDPAEMAEALNRSDLVPMQPGDIWFERGPEMAASVFQTLDLYARDLEEGTYARGISGHKEPGVSTVGQQAILNTAANRKFAAPNKQLEFMASMVGSNILRLCDTLDEVFEAQGNKLDPKDIEHDYSLRVIFQLVDPVLSMQLRQLGLQELAAGAISLETYWSSYSQLEDATGEAQRILEDRIHSLPAVQAMLDLTTAEKMGIDLEEERAKLAAVQGGTGQQALKGPDGKAVPGAGATGNALRQPLSGDVAKPGLPQLLPDGA